MGDQDQIQASQESIISGLPDDIALFCLARVPRRYHQTLRHVSRRWRHLVSSEEWYSCRRKQKLEESWIYALCQDQKSLFRCYAMDPGSPTRLWKPIRELPSRCSKRRGMSIEVLGKRIYLMGGETLSEGVSDEVYSYDPSSDTWSQAPSLSTPRCYFGCEVVDEKIYALGGLGLDSKTPRSWESFDPRTNTWTPRITCHEITECAEALCVGAGGRVYRLEQGLGMRLMVLDEETRQWAPLGRLSTQRMTPPCHLAAVGSTLFVLGKGLATIAIDLGTMRSVQGGLMLSSSLHSLNSYSDVISCRCLAI